MAITSRADLGEYLAADRDALCPRAGHARVTDPVWAFQRALRWHEWALNTGSPVRYATWARWRRLGLRLGFTIPPNVFGPGLSIAHYGTIVVNPHVRVGAGCRIHVGVNIGTAKGTDDQTPTIGDNAYLGPGAKLFGAITLGDNVTVGANAVVIRSYPEGNVTLVGVPARPIATV